MRSETKRRYSAVLIDQCLIEASSEATYCIRWEHMQKSIVTFYPETKKRPCNTH